LVKSSRWRTEMESALAVRRLFQSNASAGSGELLPPWLGRSSIGRDLPRGDIPGAFASGLQQSANYRDPRKADRPELVAPLMFQLVRARLGERTGTMPGLPPFQNAGPDTLIDLWWPRRVVDSLRKDHLASPQKESSFKSLFGIIRRGDTPMEGWQNW